jgi:hypothetical protein
MAASFPTSKKTFSQVVNGVTKLVAALFNPAYDEIEAIETRLLSGSVCQVTNYQTGAVATGSTAMNWDDTIPQITEGDEYMTYPFTPLYATSKLRIEVYANLDSAKAGGGFLFVALFQGSTPDAMAVAIGADESTNNGVYTIPLTYYMTSGTTSTITFRVRCGLNGTDVVTFNGESGSRKLGGSFMSSISITEITA